LYHLFPFRRKFKKLQEKRYEKGFALICLLFIFVSSQAQKNIRCATAEMHKTQMDQDPQYRAYYENMYQQMEKWSSQASMQRTTGGTIIVPVVVHVLWNTNTQNIF